MASGDKELDSLAQGLKLLLEAGDDTQSSIAAAIGVDQGYVSRAARGYLKFQTGRSARLADYVNMRLCGKKVPDAVLEAARAFLAGGGDPKLLADGIRLLAAVRAG